MVEKSGVERAAVVRTAEALRDRGLVTISEETVSPTEAGDAIAERLAANERAKLHTMIDQWQGADDPDLDALVEQVTERLWRDDTAPAGMLR